jgi:DNA-binding NarL/FixJ family response regulator
VVLVAPSSARYARDVSRAGAAGGAAAWRRGCESVRALAAVASRSAWGRRRIRRVRRAARAAAAPRQTVRPFREREIRFFSSEEV